MSDWGWIAMGYGVVYGVVAAYAGLLIRRVAQIRRGRDALAADASLPGTE
jgi:hypothetical protein